MLPAIPEGRLTSTVYGMIRDQEWDQALEVLRVQLADHPGNRAALSLMGYCYYSLDRYDEAVSVYSELCQRHPESERYHLALANARYKAGLYQEVLSVRGEGHESTVLRAYAKHELDDAAGLAALVEGLTRRPTDDPCVFCLKGNMLLKAGKYSEALAQYSAALEIRPDPRVLFAKALTCFRENNFPLCLRTLNELVTLSIQLYPELADSATRFTTSDPVARAAMTGLQLRPREVLASSLIEAFNLKSAVAWILGDKEAHLNALDSMPPRPLEELDPVTLHNRALAEMDSDPNATTAKLQWLITQPPFPVEAFSNLISVYIQYGLFELAADLIAGNRLLATSSLDPDKLAFFEAVVSCATSPEDSFVKLEALKTRYGAAIRRIKAEIAGLRGTAESEKPKLSLGGFTSARLNEMSAEEIQYNTLTQQFDQRFGLFVPVVCWQCAILYDMRRYAAAASVLKAQEDLLHMDPAYYLNTAHVSFAAEDYTRATEEYKLIVDSTPPQDILSVSAVALANLCVGLILINANKEAETLMHVVDLAEKEALAQGEATDRQPPLHLCVINLVIGTLYTVRGNVSFGITRIIKGLEPVAKRLSPDTWLYTKRPLLALAETCAMNLGGPPDEALIDRVLIFLDEVILHGKDTPTIGSQAYIGFVRHTTIAEEARSLKALFLNFY
ncbi:putative TPR repeat family protein [Giardia muris]|uniref:Putative TPR repeat family protein n=1 Tax=Giardia muris TaxID=5742 RepID=A0A4Z1SP85_GIAMU|nr:putative TPR repeat family protein [Giardia muris]|eukprot:TNJ27616.1 putative TPR repeat family protein [Giardia muris]